jgi:hypothetical protein
MNERIPLASSEDASPRCDLPYRQPLDFETLNAQN